MIGYVAEGLLSLSAKFKRINHQANNPNLQRKSTKISQPDLLNSIWNCISKYVFSDPPLGFYNWNINLTFADEKFEKNEKMFFGLLQSKIDNFDFFVRKF